MNRKKDRQLRKDISDHLLKLNHQMSLTWLHRLTHRELLGLWIALKKDSDRDDLIRF